MRVIKMIVLFTFLISNNVKAQEIGTSKVVGAYGGYTPFGVTLFSKQRLNIGFDIEPALGEWENGSNPHFQYVPTNPNYVLNTNYNR